MDIEELLKKAKAKDKINSEIVDTLKKGRITPIPNVEQAKRVLDVYEHDVYDPSKRKDKWVNADPSDEGDRISTVSGKNETVKRRQAVNRVGLALQKLIIKRAASFLFGIPVEYTSDSYEKEEMEEIIMKAFNRIVHDNKLKSLDRRIARNIFSYQECAEYWYSVNRKHSTYGFDSSLRLKVSLFGPHQGDKLYPYFDEYNDMVAFSREFIKDGDGVGVAKTTFFETYTATTFRRWSKTGSSSEWELVTMKDGIPLGKIPIVYGYQPYLETEDVDDLISRLETLLSNFADTNDYHASPKVVVKGKINGWSKKGEAGAVIELDGEDADVKYLSWAQAPESVKTEIETLLKMIYTISQTPDISFDAVKGLGQVSGVALKLLFMDAHLKVLDKTEIFDEYLTRRANIIKAFIGTIKSELAPACEEMTIEPTITPFMIDDEKADIEKWLAANGNKPLISHEESVKLANMSQSPADDYKRIEYETSKYWDDIQGDPITGLETEGDF